MTSDPRIPDVALVLKDEADAKIAELTVEVKRLRHIICKATTVNDGTGQVVYGEYDEAGVYQPTAALPNIPRLEAKIAALEAKVKAADQLAVFLETEANSLETVCADNTRSPRYRAAVRTFREA